MLSTPLSLQSPAKIRRIAPTVGRLEPFPRPSTSVDCGSEEEPLLRLGRELPSSPAHGKSEALDSAILQELLGPGPSRRP